MNTYKHKIRIQREELTPLSLDELRSKVVRSIIGSTLGTEVEIEVSLNELHSLPFILEPLGDYLWVIVHSSPKSLELGRKLFPERAQNEVSKR